MKLGKRRKLKNPHYIFQKKNEERGKEEDLMKEKEISMIVNGKERKEDEIRKNKKTKANKKFKKRKKKINFVRLETWNISTILQMGKMNEIAREMKEIKFVTR